MTCDWCLLCEAIRPDGDRQTLERVMTMVIAQTWPVVMPVTFVACLTSGASDVVEPLLRMYPPDGPAFECAQLPPAAINGTRVLAVGVSAVEFVGPGDYRFELEHRGVALGAATLRLRHTTMPAPGIVH